MAAETDGNREFLQKEFGFLLRIVAYVAFLKAVVVSYKKASEIYKEFRRDSFEYDKNEVFELEQLISAFCEEFEDIKSRDIYNYEIIPQNLRDTLDDSLLQIKSLDPKSAVSYLLEIEALIRDEHEDSFIYLMNAEKYSEQYDVFSLLRPEIDRAISKQYQVLQEKSTLGSRDRKYYAFKAAHHLLRALYFDSFGLITFKTDCQNVIQLLDDAEFTYYASVIDTVIESYN